MPRVDQRQTVWFYVFFLLLIVGGFCLVGYWQTYDIKCGGNKTWVWASFPPHFECSLF